MLLSPSAVAVGSIFDTILLGDCNQDGVVNSLDIPPFLVALSSGNFSVQCDVNGDGEVNFFDIAPFIALLS